MSGISVGTGLISGINTAQLIDQLLAIDARPKAILQRRVTVLQSQNTAFAEITAKLLALKSTLGNMTDPATFRNTSSTSSNTNVLTATSSNSAAPGVYNFNVSRLVTTQQSLSRGFADQSTTNVGAGTLSFEPAAARLDRDTSLVNLNGGAGVSRGKIRVTDRSGNVATVDLSKAVTVNDVLETINNSSGISVIASVEGDRLRLTDQSGGGGTLRVENLGSTNTATSLGLATDTDGDPLTLTGSAINTLSENSLLSSLNDGNGMDSTGGLDLTFDNGSQSFSVTLNAARTLGDVISAINNGLGNDDGAGGKLVTAELNADRTGLKIKYAGGSPLDIAGNSARDLGLTTTGATGDVEGTRILSGLNTKLVSNLSGGDGATLGVFSITARDGTAISNIDLTGSVSVSEVLSRINSATGNEGRIVATLNQAGNGIQLTDTTGGTGNLSITGTGADDLGLTDGTSVAANVIGSGNLQLRYISEGTRIDSLNGGTGITRGRFRITDSRGISATVDATSTGVVTIGDLLRSINSRGLEINARINDNGDGIVIEDNGPGTTAIKVEEDGSSTARELGLLGSAASAGAALNGSLEKTITLDGTEKLRDVADKINAAGLNVRAAIVNDGSPLNPFRLSLTANKAGSAGAFAFDDGGLNFGMSTLAQGRDAVVFYGASDPAQGIAITSTTNTLSNVVSGVTIDLKGTSNSAVELAIIRDDASISKSIKSMVDAFNSVIDSLNKYDTYDSETQVRGLLLGDSTVARVRSSLFGMVNRRSSEVSGQFTALTQIGIRVGSGTKLQFNESTFTQALQTDREAVLQLLTFRQTSTVDGTTTTTAAGLGVRFKELVDGITDATNGTVQSRTDSINREIKLNNDRIKAMDTLLAAKKSRYQQQFNAMELTLSRLQAQSSALAGLSGATGGTGG